MVTHVCWYFYSPDGSTCADIFTHQMVAHVCWYVYSPDGSTCVLIFLLTRWRYLFVDILLTSWRYLFVDIFTYQMEVLVCWYVYSPDGSTCVLIFYSPDGSTCIDMFTHQMVVLAASFHVYVDVGWRQWAREGRTSGHCVHIYDKQKTRVKQ